MNTTLTLKLQGLKDEIITAIRNSRRLGGVPYGSVKEILTDLKDAYIDDDFLYNTDLANLENDILCKYPEVQKELQKISNIAIDDFIDSFSDFDLRNYHINTIANRINSELNINDFEFEMDDSGYSPEVFFKFDVETWSGIRRFLVSQTGGDGLYATSITEVEPK